MVIGAVSAIRVICLIIAVMGREEIYLPRAEADISVTTIVPAWLERAVRYLIIDRGSFVVTNHHRLDL